MLTKSRKHQDQAMDFLVGCHGEMKISTDFNMLGPVFWNGEEYSALSDNGLQEILWELAELNFRFEMMALDAQAVQNRGNQHLLLHAIPHGQTMPFVAVDVSSANHGLSHPSWQQRAPYVFALVNAMRSCVHPHAFAELSQAQYYWLDTAHQLQTLFTQEVHKTMYTDRPGIVFDLAQYE
ncbi:hypothetical protein F5146DRAFT_1004042 [Armillaria mellea]|nr:hypothetical protein F5146DRAFT_1004042 [Armillaria mellea]